MNKSSSTSVTVPAVIQADQLSIRSSDLFREVRSVCIEHAGQRYLLRLTKENKLILTK